MEIEQFNQASENFQLDLAEINKEFVTLLDKHADDTSVEGASRNDFLKVKSYHDDSIDDDVECINSFWAMAYNAWDELCNIHPSLRGSSYTWLAGARFAGYSNPYDLYIGTGDEY